MGRWGGATKKSIEACIKSTQVVTYYSESRWSEQDFLGSGGEAYCKKVKIEIEDQTKAKMLGYCSSVTFILFFFI